MIGIDNDFILKNIFEVDNVFNTSKIYNINWQYSSERMELELIVNNMVKNPPKKWREWNEIYMRIDFWGIQDIKIDLNYSGAVIDSWNILEDNGKFVLYAYLANKKLIQIRYEIAHIQNIKPFNKTDTDEN